ncbi:alpha-ketoglutaric semialdehyde dehydrogenase GucD [Priestia filamentosa]|uniref:Aldehyde dehydrogenase n=3 Tax=Priestia filamentosa TaxID=1402861 RepID=A0A1X7EPP7_9BACI|nr:alpha-ketoglutaric semialdehyde dehydrogenase GucD [Priestia filamentosa]AKO93187.1 aldehyde dehydrogenase [Priestia filamentosa]MDT3763327.1 alpha-ketoglutaric semialdehyde dehydrogenase GucD [Priestia filamentosa]OXS69887.1 aldehyde dehydrogenase family protein [Priestia filamentosa]RJS63526.1 aldehyde dehydrogenase family protein [Priestia filamentosa]WRU93788.1 alpha-ketoglutaric semialdehyde dehydrogenase GucD [Priestia filamentosa]
MTVSTKAKTYLNHINGEWVSSLNEQVEASSNPANKNEIVGYTQKSIKEDLEKAIKAAHGAKKSWRKMGQAERGQFLFKVANILEENLDEIAETMTKEMGKTLPEAKGETARGVAILRYYAGEGMRKDGDVIPSSDKDALMFTRRTPLGVVGIITPWNFPVAIPIWKIAPALVYGNTVVFKPATEAAVTAAKVVECFDRAGLPKGVLNFITGSGSIIGQQLIDHPLLDAITFTGSESVGERVAKSASSRGIKFQLEMGGKNPVIVTKDANLDGAVEAVISGGFRSTGQKCTASSRVIVENEVYDSFVEKLVQETKKITVGNGLKEGIWMGPCASESQFNTVRKYIELGREEGATLITGGEILTGEEFDKGFYVTPAIFGNVQPEMKIAQEEIFGPVIALLRATNLEEAIEVANNTRYGLSASIFTSNISSLLEFIDDIDAGLVRINAESAGVELQAPFGGMKASSTGSREQGEAAKEFYTAIKTVFIKG